MFFPLTIAVAAEAAADRKQLVHDFILEHVMYHIAEADTWNLPFVHVRQLDVFRYDGTMVILSALVLIVLGSLYKPRLLVPRGWSNLLELFVQFIRDQIAVVFLGEKDGRRMTPVFCSFFFFILLMNLLGLFPLFTTATSNINVTGALACITMGFMFVGSMYRNGVTGFLKTFVPAGVPRILLPLITPIEIVSTFSKIIALMIRLFCNMLAGHIVIYALIGLVTIFGYWVTPVLGVVLFVYFFEIFIAIFQAYIFTLLSAVFIGQMVNPEH